MKAAPTGPATGRGFTAALALPLVGYALLVVLLIAGAAASVSGEAWDTACRNPNLWRAVRLSLVTSTLSTVLAIAVAVPAGYVLARHRFRGRFLLDTLLDLPIVLPPLVMGLCVLLVFSHLDRLQGLAAGTAPRDLPWRISDFFVYRPAGIVLVQFVVGCAFAIRVIEGGFANLERRYEEVAMALGANRWRTFRRVTLPLATPSLVAGVVISWARVFGLFGPVLLVAGTMPGRTEIMPTSIHLETMIGRIEVALVIALMMIVISTTLLVIFKRLGGRGYLW